MRAPVNTVVNMRITAPADDVVHSWWIPELHGKQDTIPGQVNRMWFETDTVGTYEGQCTEFCGVQHAAMKATVEVMPREEFDAWLAQQEQEQQGEATELGAEEWTAACAKCHGPNGEGLVGPSIAGNPLLADRQALEQLVREGRGTMPPVGQDWTDDQIDALFRYVSERVDEGGDEVGSEADPSGRGEQTEGEETGGD